MDAIRFNPNERAVTTPAPDDDSALTTSNLSAKQEAFAQAWAKTGNQSAAYRMAYTVHPKTLPNVVWAAASRLASLPKVEARHKELMQLATLETLMSIREFFAFQVDVATADPNEVVRVIARCCRNCYGKDFGYQWRDDVEYLQKSAEALDSKMNPPSDSGGFGYNGALEPNPICPHCYGEGHREVIVSDTTKLTGKARKLYIGAEQDRYGAIKVKMRDPQRAEEMIGRMLGVFKSELIDLRSPLEREQASRIADNITEETAGKAYLSLVS